MNGHEAETLWEYIHKYEEKTDAKFEALNREGTMYAQLQAKDLNQMNDRMSSQEQLTATMNESLQILLTKNMNQQTRWGLILAVLAGVPAALGSVLLALQIYQIVKVLN